MSVLRFTLFALIFLTSFIAQSQKFEWANYFAGNSRNFEFHLTDQYIYAMHSIDDQDTTYLTLSNKTEAFISNGETDILLSKWALDGTLIWIR